MREKSSELDTEAEYVMEKVSLSHQLASDDMSRSIPRPQGSLKTDFRKGTGLWIGLREGICKSCIWLVSRIHDLRFQRYKNSLGQ